MISVIIPCFNSEEYIVRAIESVLNQTYKSFEIILVNNNSTDNTINILNEYRRKKTGVIKVIEEFKKGAPAARNKGLSEAKGEWIQFLDADDELLPDKLADQLVTASKSKADIIVGSCYMYKNVKGKIEKKLREVETTDVWKGLLLSKLGITSANLWRREAILAAGGWNETKSSSQEYDLLFRILKNNAVVSFCSEPSTIIYVRENSIHKSIDNNRFVNILDNNIRLRIEIKNYLKSKGLLSEQLRYIADTYIYSYLINTTGVTPLTQKKGIVTDYVKKALRESNLHLPPSFIIKFHFNRFVRKVKNRL